MAYDAMGEVHRLSERLARVTVERDDLRAELASFVVIDIDYGVYCRICHTHSKSVELLVHLGNCPLNRGGLPASPPTPPENRTASDASSRLWNKRETTA
jgi:hypothetical protein